VFTPLPFDKFPEIIKTREDLGKRSQVQGSTFMVKDKEGIEDPKSSVKMLIFPSVPNLASNFGLGLTKLTLFS